MILNRPLTDEEKRKSQINYLRFNIVNGASYMCLGDTVLILFALKLNCSDTVVAVLGSMLFFGFLLLPLGKWMTARVGAARSQADFWVMRNLAALVVAAAAPAALYIGNGLAAALLIIGAFLFYGFRAAGVVMSQPLIGEICEKKTIGTFLSRSWAYFYASGLVALLLISLCTKFFSSVWVLVGIILTGTVFGVTSSGFVRKIDETGEIQRSAAHPVSDTAQEVCRNPVILRQLIAGMICNLCVILTVPISMLSLKQGYHVSDSAALLYSLVQFAASIGGSWLMSKFADRFGGRKMTLFGYAGFFVIALFWMLAPSCFCWPLLILPFLLCPCGTVITSSALQIYFICTVPKKLQVVAAMVIAVGTGVISGLLGMVLSSGLLKASALLNHTGIPLNTYRIYFAGVLVLLAVFSVFVLRLKAESELPKVSG